MTYRFDKQKLTQCLRDFYSISKITMSVWDADFNQITFYPNPMSPICAQIKSSPKGKMECLNSDIAACIMASKIRRPHTFTCHAGLIDTVIPIYYNNALIAYIMFGQIRDREENLSNIDNVKKLCKKYNIDEKAIEEHYQQLPILERGQIDAIANLFTKCVPYFYTSQAIKIEQNELASEIEDYIVQNIELAHSIDDLCNKFKISKNILYQLSHKFFKSTIKDFVITKRIEKATHYLTTTQMPISEISLKVGFNDYNYFIRTFKLRTGHTPLSYRKNFPLNIL